MFSPVAPILSHLFPKPPYARDCPFADLLFSHR
jgi:hypothetical protein